jgi:uncharacterized protein YraI
MNVRGTLIALALTVTSLGLGPAQLGVEAAATTAHEGAATTPSERSLSTVGVASQIALQRALTPPGEAQRSVAAQTTATARAKSAANVRGGPGTSYAVITTLRARAEVPATGRNANGSWVQVQVNGRVGWVASSLVTVRGGSLPVVSGTVPPPPVTATPMPPTPYPAPTATPLPTCDFVPVRGFGVVWAEHREVQGLLGCPQGPQLERGTEGAIQTFQHGTVIWLADDGGFQPADPYFILFNDGSWTYFPDMGAPAEVRETPPPGLYAPTGRFARLWLDGTGAKMRERLGWATAPAQDTPASVQAFWTGRMIWLKATDRVYITSDRWNDQGRQRIWLSFEDKFEG